MTKILKEKHFVYGKYREGTHYEFLRLPITLGITLAYIRNIIDDRLTATCQPYTS